uniref:LON peptidase N-terminal domain and ring finger 3 n=1 Tax=Sparus aurata TaxID=8175 RepID=A0A671Y3B7_SPAAU
MAVEVLVTFTGKGTDFIQPRDIMGTESESMLQLAAEAFQSKNFDLAADIYQCQLAGLGDAGSRQEMMVKRADALAFGGKLTEAFEVYRQASETERLRPVHLSNLIEYLSDSIRRQDGDSQGRIQRRGEEAAGCQGGYEDLSCRICLSFLYEPVTLPCGHCFCKKCLERERKEKEQPVMCKECRDSSRVADVQSYRVNVVLSNLLAKWFPTQHQAGQLRREGNGLYSEKKMEAALEKYNQAIMIAPMDHILFSNRSQIHSTLRHYESALRDAEMACRLMPLWSKVLHTTTFSFSTTSCLIMCLTCIMCLIISLSGPAEVNESSVGDVLDPTDLECSLCMRIFYEPVTTPCGHTFCLQCLERCLDHNPMCPLCKEELSEYLVQRQYCKTVLMETLISKYLPSELMERQKIHQDEIAELSNLNKNVPIFVCTMAFPTVPCPLHIFEPCYRLMIRRCMETGTNCFGMCLADNLKGFADYGCLLEIRDVKFFSDGRSVVDTVGRRRFKVIQHRERDGYNTADIEYLEDVKVEGMAERELQSLHDTVYDQALVWVNSLKAEQKERIEGHFGPMPRKDSVLQTTPNGPSWCWWLLAVFPLEGRAQLPFLALTSLKDRLSGIRKVLLFMAHSKPR